MNVHVVLIHAYNMKANAFTSCISYAQSCCIKSGVGAGYGLFTSVGEWVVNSGKMGQSLR